jgi:hypothetical protein
MNGQGEWAEAYQKAVAFVSQLTLAEKVNLTTGVGYVLQCPSSSKEICKQELTDRVVGNKRSVSVKLEKFHGNIWTTPYDDGSRI